MCPSKRRRLARRQITSHRVAFYKKHIEELCEKYPLTFNRAFPRPLKIGIDKEIQEATGWDATSVSAVLSVWVARREYTYMACSLGKRYDLAGAPVTAIDESELKSFILAMQRMNKDVLRSFIKDYKEVFGKPALLCVPIKERPDDLFIH